AVREDCSAGSGGNGVTGGGGAGELKADIGYGRSTAVRYRERLWSAGHARLLVGEGEAGGIDAERSRRQAGSVEGHGLRLQGVGNSERAGKCAQLRGSKDHADGSDRVGGN